MQRLTTFTLSFASFPLFVPDFSSLCFQLYLFSSCEYFQVVLRGSLIIFVRGFFHRIAGIIFLHLSREFELDGKAGFSIKQHFCPLNISLICRNIEYCNRLSSLRITTQLIHLCIDLFYYCNSKSSRNIIKEMLKFMQ